MVLLENISQQVISQEMLNLRGLIKISISNGRKLPQRKKFQWTSFQSAGQASFFLRMQAATFFRLTTVMMAQGFGLMASKFSNTNWQNRAWSK